MKMNKMLAIPLMESYPVDLCQYKHKSTLFFDDMNILTVYFARGEMFYKETLVHMA